MDTRTMLPIAFRKKPEPGPPVHLRHADLHVHKQQPVNRRRAHERLVLERKLHLGFQRESKPAPDTRRERTTSRPLHLATLTLRRRRRNDVETQTSTGDVWTYGYDFRGRMVTAVEKPPAARRSIGDVHLRCSRQSHRHGRKWHADWTLYDLRRPDHGLQQLRLPDYALPLGTERNRCAVRPRAGRFRGTSPTISARCAT